jgi:hypothetical protein
MTPSNYPASEQSSIKANDWIPEGYVRALDPEDREYIVPEYIVPAMHLAYAGYRHTNVLDAFGAAGSVSRISLYRGQLPAGSDLARCRCVEYCRIPAIHVHSQCPGRHVVWLVRQINCRYHVLGAAHRHWELFTLLHDLLNFLLILPIFQQTHESQGHHFNVIGEDKVMIPLLPVNNFYVWHAGIRKSHIFLTL